MPIVSIHADMPKTGAAALQAFMAQQAKRIFTEGARLCLPGYRALFSDRDLSFSFPELDAHPQLRL
jgi:hypothetical protein